MACGPCAGCGVLAPGDLLPSEPHPDTPYLPVHGRHLLTGLALPRALLATARWPSGTSCWTCWPLPDAAPAAETHTTGPDTHCAGLYTSASNGLLFSASVAHSALETCDPLCLGLETAGCGRSAPLLGRNNTGLADTPPS